MQVQNTELDGIVGINFCPKSMYCVLQYIDAIMSVKGGITMVAKSANVSVRVEPDIKAQAEAILEQLGISASSFINMTYRQVILKRGIPFAVTIPHSLPTRDSMSDEEFEQMISASLEQAKRGESIPFGEAMDKFMRGL